MRSRWDDGTTRIRAFARLVCFLLSSVALLWGVSFGNSPSVVWATPDQSLAEAKRLLRRAQSHLQHGRWERAFELYVALIDPADCAMDSGLVHLGCLNASELATELGRFDEARAYALRAIEASAHLEPVLRAKSLTNLGRACQGLNLHDEALEHHAGSLAIQLEIGNDEGIARSQNNLASVYLETGNYQKALKETKASIEICLRRESERWSGSLRRYATANRSGALELIGQVRAAHEAYQTMLREPDLSPKEEAFVLTGAGRAQLKLGDATEATSLLGRAVSLYEEIGDRRGLTNVLQHIGVTECVRFQSHEEAQILLRRALDLSTETKDRFEGIYSRLHLARCLLHTQDIEGAEALLLEAGDETEAIGVTEGEWISRYGLGQVAEAKGEIRRALSLYRESLSIIERIREENVPEKYRASYLGETGIFWDKLDVLAAAVRLSLGDRGAEDPERVTSAFSLIERFRARSLMDRLGAKVLSLSEIRDGILGDGEVLIELIPIGEELAVFVIARERATVTRIPLTTSLLNHMHVSSSGESLESRFSPGRLSCLSTELLAPILRSVPESTRSLVLVSDVTLGEVPWSALTIDDGGRFLVESLSLSAAPSASVFGHLRELLRDDFSLDLIAFGDPDLTVPDSSKEDATSNPYDLYVKSHRLQSLARSRNEVEQVRDRVDGRTTVCTAEEATVSRFVELISLRPRIVHLATHSVVSSTKLSASAILFSRTPESSGGFLWADEIAEMTIDADLVTLSSCRSAGSKYVPGEGAMGLARSFVAAGSRSVLCTAGEVEDGASAVMMDSFYAELKLGRTVAEALRCAQIRAITTDPSVPWNWALYSVVGDGSVRLFEAPPRRIVIGVALSLAAGLFTAALVFAGLRLRRQ